MSENWMSAVCLIRKAVHTQHGAAKSNVSFAKRQVIPRSERSLAKRLRHGIFSTNTRTAFFRSSKNHDVCCCPIRRKGYESARVGQTVLGVFGWRLGPVERRSRKHR